MTNIEFDERKRLANIEKHGIDFKQAIAAFRDPSGFEYRSDRDNTEQRCVLIGKAGETILAVVFTIRGEAIRIISARKARKKEVALWHGNTS